VSLVEQTLDGPVYKIATAIGRLRTFEPKEGYYLAFSGGKDSQVIYDLAKRAGIHFDAHLRLTTVDPPELIKHVRENYPDVQIHHPGTSMFRLIVERGFPPTRKIRYCCSELKEVGGSGRVVLTGIRWQESVRRSKRRLFETCQRDGTRHFLHPIIDWSTEEVWEYIHRRDLPYCSLYDEGYKRLGCIMCPMSSRGMVRDMHRYPRFYRAYLLAFRKMLHRNAERGKPLSWKTAEEVMHWWVYEINHIKEQAVDQTTLECEIGADMGGVDGVTP